MIHLSSLKRVEAVIKVEEDANSKDLVSATHIIHDQDLAHPKLRKINKKRTRKNKNN